MAVIEEKNPKKWTKDKRRFYFDVYYIDIYGKRKEYKSKMFASRKIAREEESHFLEQIRTRDLTDYNITFTDVYEEWLDFKEQKVKATTFYGLELRCNKHILSFFKDFKLHDIKVQTLLTWKKQIMGKDLSIEALNIIISHLKEILDYATDNYDFDKKVSSKLQKVRDDTPKQKNNDSETNYLTYEQYKKFINVVDDEAYNLIFEFLYYTGLRIGEFTALTWRNVNLEDKTITIRESLTTKVKNKHKKDGETHAVLTPKTSNSVRIVDLDDKLVERLKEHHNKEKHVYGFNEDMFVFGNVKYIAQTTLRRKLDKYITLAKVKRITPHGFRHSHVSLLIYLGCDVYEVAERIGDTVDMVLKTYYHMFPNKKKHTINVINKLKIS